MENIFDSDWDYPDDIFSFKDNSLEEKEKKDFQFLKENTILFYEKNYSKTVNFMKTRNIKPIMSCGGFKKWKNPDKRIIDLLTHIENDIEGFLNWSLVSSQILSLRTYEYLRHQKKFKKNYLETNSYLKNNNTKFNYNSYINMIQKNDKSKKSFCCPFHTEKTPSFVYHFNSGNFHCYGCGKHLNFISFIQELFLLTQKEAIFLLNEHYKRKHFGQIISPKKNMALRIWKPILIGDEK